MRSALSSPPFHPPSECNLEVFTKMIDSIVSMNIYHVLCKDNKLVNVSVNHVRKVVINHVSRLHKISFL